jgi:hypothetical protein
MNHTDDTLEEAQVDRISIWRSANWPLAIAIAAYVIALLGLLKELW